MEFRGICDPMAAILTIVGATLNDYLLKKPPPKSQDNNRYITLIMKNILIFVFFFCVGGGGGVLKQEVDKVKILGFSRVLRCCI